MNEQEQISQLSALFDGELPTQQAEMVMRRALKDDVLRASWDRYALIGACVRNEPLPRHQSVADRVQAALAGERDHNVTVLSPKTARAGADSARPGSSWYGRGALGGAIAAGVAVISIVVVRSISADSQVGPLLADIEPAGYTTPGENSPAQQGRMVDASLGHYLVAHSEEAASALRSSFDLGSGGVVLTEDQVSALR